MSHEEINKELDEWVKSPTKCWCASKFGVDPRTVKCYKENCKNWRNSNGRDS